MDAADWPLWFNLQGKTNMALRKRFRYALFRSGSGGSTGVYTLKRSAHRVKAVNKLVQRLAKGKLVYLVTGTWRPCYSEKERARMWQRFVDRMRKEREVYAYQWVRERHPGPGPNEGTFHVHAAVVCSTTWNWRKRIQEWSKRYTGSNNGLDVKERRHAGYLIKYIVKGRDSGDEASCRWWGCSKLQRSMVVTDAGHVEVMDPEWADNAYLCGTWYLDRLAKASAVVVDEKRKRWTAQRLEWLRLRNERDRLRSIGVRWSCRWPKGFAFVGPVMPVNGTPTKRERLLVYRHAGSSY